MVRSVFRRVGVIVGMVWALGFLRVVVVGVVWEACSFKVGVAIEMVWALGFSRVSVAIVVCIAGNSRTGIGIANEVVIVGVIGMSRVRVVVVEVVWTLGSSRMVTVVVWKVATIIGTWSIVKVTVVWKQGFLRVAGMPDLSRAGMGFSRVGVIIGMVWKLGFSRKDVIVGVVWTPGLSRVGMGISKVGLRVVIGAPSSSGAGIVKKGICPVSIFSVVSENSVMRGLLALTTVTVSGSQSYVSVTVGIVTDTVCAVAEVTKAKKRNGIMSGELHTWYLRPFMRQ
jgi:hypothetical protein